MVSINKTSNQPYSPNNQKTHSGLKVGLATTALGALGAYHIRGVFDFAEELVKTATRDQLNNCLQSANNVMLGGSGPRNLGLAVLQYPHLNEIQGQVDTITDNAMKSLNIIGSAKKAYSWKKTIAKAAPVYIGAGLIVDYMNNRQRAKTEPNAKTKNGNDYVKTNMGKKYGWMLGLAAGPLLSKGSELLKNPIGKCLFVAGVVASTIGGEILGVITDKLSNRKAAKAADKNA